MIDNKYTTCLVSVAAGFIYILLGIVMIQNPETTLSALSIVIGWFVFLGGVLAVIFALMFRKVDRIVSQSNLSDGMLLLFLALIFLFGSFINNTLFFSYLLILWILMDSVFQLQVMSLFPATGVTVFLMIIDIVTIALAVFLLFNPAAAEGFLVVYIGIGFISTGLAKMIKAY